MSTARASHHTAPMNPYRIGSGAGYAGDRIDPARSNIAGMASDFWHNGMWHHSDVAGAIFETILMAFLGTFGAGLIALPHGQHGGAVGPRQCIDQAQHV